VLGKVWRVRLKIELTEVHRSVTASRALCAAISNSTKLFGMIVMLAFNQTASMWFAESIESTLSG